MWKWQALAGPQSRAQEQRAPEAQQRGPCSGACRCWAEVSPCKHPQLVSLQLEQCIAHLQDGSTNKCTSRERGPRQASLFTPAIAATVALPSGAMVKQ